MARAARVRGASHSGHGYGRRQRVHLQSPRRTSVQWQPPAGGPPEWEPLPVPRSLPELWAAMHDRLRFRRCEGALARTAEGRPTLPEMQAASYWSEWGAFFAEVARGGLSIAQRCDAEADLKIAMRGAELDAGTRMLSGKQVSDMLDMLLAHSLEPGDVDQEPGH